MRILMILAKKVDISLLDTWFTKVLTLPPKYCIVRRGVDKIPTSLDTYDLVLIHGSLEVILKNYCTSWMQDEKNLIKSIIRSQKPTIGICWGSTHIAHELGVPTLQFSDYAFGIQNNKVICSTGCTADISDYISVFDGIRFIQPSGNLTPHVILSNGTVDVYSYQNYIMGSKGIIGLTIDNYKNSLNIMLGPQKKQMIDSYLEKVYAAQDRKFTQDKKLLRNFLVNNGLLS